MMKQWFAVSDQHTSVLRRAERRGDGYASSASKRRRSNSCSGCATVSNLSPNLWIIIGSPLYSLVIIGNDGPNSSFTWFFSGTGKYSREHVRDCNQASNAEREHASGALLQLLQSATEFCNKKKGERIYFPSRPEIEIDHVST